MIRKKFKKIFLVALVLSVIEVSVVYAETDNMIQKNEVIDLENDVGDTQSLRATTIPGKWIQASDGRWWYQHADSTYTKNNWEYIDGKWYYFDSEGWMKTGWIQVNGKWYYLDSTGAMRTGWVMVDGRWFYLNGSGVMLTGWQKLSFSGYNNGKPYYNYFNAYGAFITDSDYRGCEHGYSNFGDYRYSVAPDQIKYHSYCSVAQNAEISKGCAEWNKNEVSYISGVSSGENLKFYPATFYDDTVLARTKFYIGGEWGVRPGNWPMARVEVSSERGIIGSDTIAHEIGHAYGLSHRISNKNSIMCQKGNGRNVTTVQPTDLDVLRHIY